MFDGVFRQMVRPLVLSGQSPPVWRVGSGLAGSWPRFIGWVRACRGRGLGDGLECLVAEFLEDVVAAFE